MKTIVKSSITVSDLTGVSVELMEDFEEIKINALARASVILAVNDPESKAEATKALIDIDNILKQVEKDRKWVKEEPMRICKMIDNLAKEAVLELSIKANDLRRMMSDFMLKQEEERMAKEEQRQEEILMISASKKISHEKKDEMIRESVPVALEKTEGLRVGFTLKYYIVDMDAFFKAHPSCCEIIEKKREINNLINGLYIAGKEQIPTIPGLRVYKDANISTRSL